MDGVGPDNARTFRNVKIGQCLSSFTSGMVSVADCGAGQQVLFGDAGVEHRAGAGPGHRAQAGAQPYRGGQRDDLRMDVHEGGQPGLEYVGFAGVPGESGGRVDHPAGVQVIGDVGLGGRVAVSLAVGRVHHHRARSVGGVAQRQNQLLPRDVANR